jgi:hypothetical protein
MLKEQVAAELDRRPFIPLCIFPKNGKRYDIPFRQVAHLVGYGVLILIGLKEGTHQAKSYDRFCFEDIDRIVLRPRRDFHDWKTDLVSILLALGGLLGFAWFGFWLFVFVWTFGNADRPPDIEGHPTLWDVRWEFFEYAALALSGLVLLVVAAWIFLRPGRRRGRGFEVITRADQ